MFPETVTKDEVLRRIPWLEQAVIIFPETVLNEDLERHMPLKQFCIVNPLMVMLFASTFMTASLVPPPPSIIVVNLFYPIKSKLSFQL